MSDRIRKPAIEPEGLAAVKDLSAASGDLNAEGDRGTEFSRWDALTLGDASGIEQRLARLGRRFRRDLYFSLAGANRKEFRGALKFYTSPAFRSDSSLLFLPPAESPDLVFARAHPLEYGEVVEARFASGYLPRYPEFRERFQSYPENRQARVRFWRHPHGQSRGCVIAVHGWCLGDRRIHALTLAPGFFFRLGLDVVLYELPYHGRRIGKGRESPFPGPDLALTNEGVAQAVYELRGLRLWLQRESPQPVGVVGMSLGGYLAALWATLDRLAFVIAVVPLVSMAEVALEVLKSGGPAGYLLRELLAGSSVEELMSAYAVHSPLRLSPIGEPRRLLLVAAAQDSVVALPQSRLLERHWKGAHVHWFKGDHFDYFAKEGFVFRRVHDFLLSLGLANPELLDIKEAPARAA